MLAQAAERGAQIVGDVARHLAQAVHQLLDAAQHGVEARHQLVDLVARAALGNARRQIALHDGAAGAGDGVDAAQEARADQRAAGDGEQQRKPARPHEGAGDGVLHLGEPVGVLGDQQERAIGQGQAEAGELGRVGVDVDRLGLGHEIDDAVDRRHARQIADHDTAVGRLQEIEDGTARAEVQAPPDLVGQAREAAAAVNLGELVGLGAQHRRHVVLHRRRRRPVDGDEQHGGRHHEQHGIDQRQPEARRAQDPGEFASRGRG